MFPFTYNGIVDKTQNPDYDSEQFWPKQNVVAKFSTHAINFKFIAKLNSIFNYNFRL